jgi:peptidylamidoglycolate lyase
MHINLFAAAAPWMLAMAALAQSGSAPYQVVHGWPQYPDGFSTREVAGVGVDSHGHVFVFHRGRRPILCLDPETGRVLASWGDGMFGSAHGLALDNKDNVWVTDTVRHQVIKFSHDGELLMTVGAKDVPGADPRHFNRPTDVAIAPNGDFWVADGYGNSRIVRFTAGGEYVTEWGVKGDKPGEFDTPHGITLDKQGRVYVADRGNARIQVFEGNGKLLHVWKSEELGRPWAVEVGPDGYLYVADGGDLHQQPEAFERNRALKLDLNGNILATWGSFGSYDGQFYWAHDIAAGPKGEVYVGDVYWGMRVQKFIPRR